MKKMSIVLVLALIFSLCLPFHVNAAENDDHLILTYEELVALGCTTFPEYADNIASPRSPIVQTRSSEDPVVIRETRSISENETMTYEELASGRAFISFNDLWSETSSSTSGNTKTVTGSLTVFCNISSQVFYIRNFKYKIDYSGYDSILNLGDRELTTCHLVYDSGNKLNEDAAGPAFCQYEALFVPNDHTALVPCAGRINLTVGNDNFSISVSG